MRVLILVGLMMVVVAVGWVGFGLVVVVVSVGCVGNLLGSGLMVVVLVVLMVVVG